MLTEQDLEKEISESAQRDIALRNKVKTMFVMQDALNKIIHPEWYTQEMDGELWNFQTAALVELGELIDHYGYKWWKKQTPNVDQCTLEIVDIAHFLISDMLQRAYHKGVNLETLVDDFLAQASHAPIVEKTPFNIRSNIKVSMSLAADNIFNARSLGILMNLFDLTIDDLSNKYILKNTLNIFRARNGYKQGTYVKTWGGREDNEVLMDVYMSLDSNSTTFAEELYAKLDEEYKKYN